MLFECRKHYGIPCKNDEQIEETTIHTTMAIDATKAEKDILYFEQHCKSSEALKFYTKDLFLYRLFNQAFRTENIDLLFIFRFFLADMNKHLQKLYTEQFPYGLPNTVYRGQLMTISEFDSVKNNIGQLMSVNTFFSTSEQRDVAELYSGFSQDANSNLLSVLFAIEIDLVRATSKRPFASIKGISTIIDEDEVLFSVGSVFRIEYVQDRRTNDGYWYVKLKMAEDDVEMSELRKELEKVYCDESDLCNLGQVLNAMGDYQRAERYFLMLLEYIPDDHPNAGRIYSCLGRTAQYKGNHQMALSYHEKALEHLNKPSIYNEQENIGGAYVNIGVSYQKLGNLDLAMKYLTMATEIQRSPKSLSYTYNQIAMVYRDKGDKQSALAYFQKTLHIEEQVLQVNQYNPVLATMHNNIGEIYVQLGDNENALKHLHRALDIRLKSNGTMHTDLAANYINLGMLYHSKKELKKALEVLEKALEIDTQTFGSNHESLASTHCNIGAIYQDMNDLTRALYHAETALRILLRSQAGENHADVFKVQCLTGVIQFRLGDNIKALKITQKALKNQLRKLPENDELFAQTYVLLAETYKKEKDDTTASEYIGKAQEIARISILPYDKLRFQCFQQYLDQLRMKNDQSNDGLVCIGVDTGVLYSPDNCDQQDHLLSTQCDNLIHISPDDIIHRLKALNNIGALCSKKEDYQMALKHFGEAVELFNQNYASDRFFPEQLENLIINIYFGISRVYYRQNEWTMSLNNLEKALQFALKQKQEAVILPEIYHCIGLAYKHKFDFFMAIHYLELAISTAKKCLPENHPRIQIYLDNLQALKSSLSTI